MKTILLSSSRSGMSLLSGILDCSPNVSVSLMDANKMCGLRPEYDFRSMISETSIGVFNITPQLVETHGITILDVLHVMKHTTLKFLWLVRNPVVVAASCVKMLNMEARKALEFWNVSNTCLWYLFHSLPPDRRMFIKYEDMILDPKTIKGAFEFLGEKYSAQYLQYGDFDHESIGCPVFSKGRIDSERIDPHIKDDFVDIWSKYKNNKMILDIEYNEYFD